MKDKIKLEDSVPIILQKMSEGNPGALRVCMSILSKAPKIDADDAFGGLGPILMLDTLGIYGPSIWMMYKDVCNEDVPKVIALLRGFQLGFLTKEALLHAIDNRGAGVDVEDICRQVKEFLPNFQFTAPKPEPEEIHVGDGTEPQPWPESTPEPEAAEAQPTTTN